MDIGSLLGGVTGGAGGGGTEVLSVVNMIANMASAFSANRAYGKESAGLTTMQKGLHLAPEWNRAEDLYRSELGVGQHDYEQRQQETKTGTATSLREASDFLTQGGMVEALSKLYGNQNKQLTENQRANELAIEGHKKDYATFLGEKGKATDELMRTGRQLELAKLGLDFNKAKDLTSYANKGAEQVDPMRMLTQLLSMPGMADKLAAMIAENEKKPKPTGGGTDSIVPIGKIPHTIKNGYWDEAGEIISTTYSHG